MNTFCIITDKRMVFGKIHLFNIYGIKDSAGSALCSKGLMQHSVQDGRHCPCSMTSWVFCLKKCLVREWPLQAHALHYIYRRNLNNVGNKQFFHHIMKFVKISFGCKVTYSTAWRFGCSMDRSCIVFYCFKTFYINTEIN